MTTEQKAKGTGAAIASIMAIYALGASQGGVNAGMATMGAAFPEAGANIAYVVSMVALGMIPAGAISGMVTGKFIKYKTSVLLAIVLYLISGLAPAFFPDGASWTLLLVTRFIFGLAVGWCYPLAQALVFKMFEDKKQRAKWLGTGMAFFNIGSALMELGGGYLAVVSWQAVFFVYAIGIIPLVLVAFLFKEPETDEQQAQELAEATGGEVNKHIPPIAFAYMLLLCLCVTFAMPVILYASFAIGDPTTSGWVLSAMTVVGAITGFTLGPLYKKAGKWTPAIGAIYLAVFFVICGIAVRPGTMNVVLYIVCFLVGHWGFAIIIPATSNMVSNLVPIGAATRAMGWTTAFHQAGCFLATPAASMLMMVTGDTSVTDVMLTGAIVLAVCAVILLILTIFTDMSKYGDNYGRD